VGRALVRLIFSSRKRHSNVEKIKLKFLAVSDSTQMIVAQRSKIGIPDADISKLVHHKETGQSLSTYTNSSKATASIGANELERILEIARELANYDRIVVVDTTSSNTSKLLQNALENFDCAIVSANKVPFADTSTEMFHALSHSSSSRFESTVGAGLPVISTIDRLLRGGDDVVRISGSLSGTLGYIMSKIEDGKTCFSDAVLEAKKRGFTEPDPRDDLSGTDVARKALIMARRIGVNASMRDVTIEPLFPVEMKKLSLDQFMKRLSELDDDMSARVVDANQRKGSLRYVATLDLRPAKPVLRVGLEVVPRDSSLALLRGTENMVCIATKFYNITQPLVIRGAGAGVEVTASGVLSDIIDLVI